jgi:hypothetical protein
MWLFGDDVVALPTFVYFGGSKVARRRRRRDTDDMADKRKKTIGKTVAPMVLVRGAGITTETIAAKAYELYLARDGEHGHDVEDWLAAETELRG